MMRCKFKCDSISEFTGSFEYKLSPVFSQDPKHENKAFWEATPAGSFQIHVIKSKGKLFDVGKEYYLDIQEA